jgi:hypothetical protein
MLQRMRDNETGGTAALMARPAIKLPAHNSGGNSNNSKVRQDSVGEWVSDMLEFLHDGKRQIVEENAG